MRKPLPMALRQLIVSRYKKGEKITRLSRHYEVSRSTIYTLIKRDKTSGLEPLYENCGKIRPSSKSFIFRAVKCMRTWHPDWGAEKIRAEMHQMRPKLKLPHYRTFNRWFHWNKQMKISFKSILPKFNIKQAKRLHECWQIDAKEELKTADGNKQCWLNIVDEYSGTVIAPPVFSL